MPAVQPPADGFVGKVKDGKRQQGTTLIIAPRLAHSEKPAQMREYIERVSYEPRLELFGRSVPADWDAIGLELESFQAANKRATGITTKERRKYK